MPKVHDLGLAHAFPQSPQLLESDMTSVHAPPQHAEPDAQSASVAQLHAPLLQTPLAQATPHAPQFAGSDAPSVHAPLQHDTPPQSRSVAHAGGAAAQAPDTHDAPFEHAAAQLPQFFGSERRSSKVSSDEVFFKVCAAIERLAAA